MNRGCYGRYDMTRALPCFQQLVVLHNKKSQNPRKPHPKLAMCCENEPELWASPTDSTYCVGTLEQRLDILVKLIELWYWTLNTSTLALSQYKSITNLYDLSQLDLSCPLPEKYH